MCLRRLAAATIDLLIWFLLAIFVLAPILAVVVLIAFLGYLENYQFFFTSIVSAVLVYLIVSTGALLLFIPYYTCRFESSQWQGTFGKYILGVECFSGAGERPKFFEVARRLILQALLFGMLVGVISVFMSANFRELLSAISPAAPHRGFEKMPAWVYATACAVLIAPYAVALFTGGGQTLVDLMVGRKVGRAATRERLPLTQLIGSFVQILLPHDTVMRQRMNKVAFAFVQVLALVWLFSIVLTVLACVALPIDLLQVDQLLKAHDEGAIEKYSRRALFRRTDVIYGLMASNTKSDDDFRIQSLSNAIMLNPARHYYWYWRAQRLFASGKYSNALADASQAIRVFDVNNATIVCPSFFGLIRLKLLPGADIDEGSLYSLRALVEQKLGDNLAAFADLTKAINLGHAEDYTAWLKLNESIKKQKDDAARVELPKIAAIANAAYKVLLKSPARFQEKKDLYNQVIYLNNEAVTDLLRNDFDAAIKKLLLAEKQDVKLRSDKTPNQDDFEIAFEKWQKALNLDSRSGLTRRNLAIAYDGKAKTITDPELALTFLHRAFYCDPLNEPVQVNIATTIKKLGLDPNSFEDHIKLADSAMAKKDLQGANVECALALKIKNDLEVKKMLTRRFPLLRY